MSEASRDLFFQQKGVAVKSHFKNELLEDIYQVQKEEGDTEGMELTKKIYVSCRNKHEEQQANQSF